MGRVDPGNADLEFVVCRRQIRAAKLFAGASRGFAFVVGGHRLVAVVANLGPQTPGKNDPHPLEVATSDVAVRALFVFPGRDERAGVHLGQCGRFGHLNPADLDRDRGLVLAGRANRSESVDRLDPSIEWNRSDDVSRHAL